MVTLAAARNAFLKAGVTFGDHLLLHSSYKSMGGVEGGPAAFLQMLIDLVTPQGTLILPTFSFDFCSSGRWDARTSPSQMGIVTEIARQRPDGVRLVHPVYSFVAFGRYAPVLGRIRTKSGTGPGSLFTWLRAQNGLIGILGLSWQDSWTAVHHAEEMETVPYRFLKEFHGDVTDVDGTVERGAWQVYVRDWDRGVITAVDPMGVRFEALEMVCRQGIGAACLKVILARDSHEETVRVIRSGRAEGLLYQVVTPEQAKERP